MGVLFFYRITVGYVEIFQLGGGLVHAQFLRNKFLYVFFYSQMKFLGMIMMVYCCIVAKCGNISEDMCLGSCGDGPKILQRGRKSKVTSKGFFQKWTIFGVL